MDKPSRFCLLLGLVRKLMDYGRQLATSLPQRSRAELLLSFRTSDIALILARITSGLHRASALETRLVQCAARPDAETKPQGAVSQRGPRIAGPATRGTREADPSLARLPTPEQIAAQVRRRPIGAVIVDICRDLGILPSHPLWRELQRAIIEHGGSLADLYMSCVGRPLLTIAPGPPAASPPASPALPACAHPP